VSKLVRLELRFLGKQQETVLNARSEGLKSERVHQAIAKRAEIEAERLALRIEGRTIVSLRRAGLTSSDASNLLTEGLRA
jgi:hypothetical protein